MLGLVARLLVIGAVCALVAPFAPVWFLPVVLVGSMVAAWVGHAMYVREQRTSRPTVGIGGKR